MIKNSTIKLVCLFSKRVFEAAVDTAVILFKKSKENVPLKIYKDLIASNVQIEQSELSVAPDYLFPVMVGNEGKKIINKLNKSTDKRFVDFLEVQQGIIYSGKLKSEVFSNEQLTSQYKKVLDGRDVFKYYINWDEKKENRFIKYTRDLHRPREERIFLAQEKIILPRRSTHLVCSIDDSQYYLLNTAYIILPKKNEVNLHFILAILNSKLVDFYYNNLYFGWQITIPALNSIPILQGDAGQQQEIEILIDTILSLKKQNKEADTKDLESKIDELVMDLYQLTEEEKEIIRKS